MSHTIHDPALAPAGLRKIEWVQAHMPLLRALESEYRASRPLAGLRVTMSIHLEAKTAYLALVLRAAGADVAVTGCNPLSTQDDVAAALASLGLSVHAVYGATAEQYESHLISALSHRPHLLIDDGGDLVALLHGDHAALAADLIGGCEETTTGVMRLRARAAAGTLRFPMIDINDADCKHLFDNRYGTGQSVWDGIMRTTNLIVAGKAVVIAGYGWCGKGVARRALGLGARVIVTEVDPIKALEALMDGCEVLPMAQAAAIGDVFVTLTGCRDVIRREHIERMKDGAILANAGHFDVEISKPDLEAVCGAPTPARHNIEAYARPDGARLYLLAEGRLVNLAAGDGHPAEIMDMSFALQAQNLCYLAGLRGADGTIALAPGVYDVPREIDEDVARRLLAAQGFAIDALSDAQAAYLKGTGA